MSIFQSKMIDCAKVFVKARWLPLPNGYCKSWLDRHKRKGFWGPLNKGSSYLTGQELWSIVQTDSQGCKLVFWENICQSLWQTYWSDISRSNLFWLSHWYIILAYCKLFLVQLGEAPNYIYTCLYIFLIQFF